LVLWRNRQTKAHLVWRPKPRNRPPPWFWDSTKKPTTCFEAKPGETVATSFEAKLEKTIATSFEAKLEKTFATGFKAKPVKTVATGFEAKPPETITTSFEAELAKTVWVVLSPNHSQNVTIGFEAQIDDKSSQWFWGQNTDKQHEKRQSQAKWQRRVRKNSEEQEKL
jgi:hypothetical protein